MATMVTLISLTLEAIYLLPLTALFQELGKFNVSTTIHSGCANGLLGAIIGA